jgi:hydrogenase expression/formation protein HypC
MCLGLPVKIVKKKGTAAEVEIEGIRRQVNLLFTPEAKVGDYVLLHAGFAIQVLDDAEARESLELLKQLIESSETN